MEPVTSSSTETKRCGCPDCLSSYTKPNTSSSTETKRCGVCTGFLSGQPFMTSECAHTFHVGCYQHRSNKNQTCPVCFARWTGINKNNAQPTPPLAGANIKPQPSNPNPKTSPPPLAGLIPPYLKPQSSPYSYYPNPFPYYYGQSVESIAKARESMGGTNYYYPDPYFYNYSFPSSQYFEPEARLLSDVEASVENMSIKAEESIAKAEESIAKARENIAKARESVAKTKSFRESKYYF